MSATMIQALDESQQAPLVKLGLISDTHAVFDPAVVVYFSGMHQILHAGDVGHHGSHKEVLQQLATSTSTPVLAVAGNVDDKLDAAGHCMLPSHRVIHAAGWVVLLVHIVAAGPATKIDASVASLVQQIQPDIVVCGHSHKPACWVADGVYYINPGSAGPARFKLPRTVATLTLPQKGARNMQHTGSGLTASAMMANKEATVVSLHTSCSACSGTDGTREKSQRKQPADSRCCKTQSKGVDEQLRSTDRTRLKSGVGVQQQGPPSDSGNLAVSNDTSCTTHLPDVMCDQMPFMLQFYSLPKRAPSAVKHCATRKR